MARAHKKATTSKTTATDNSEAGSYLITTSGASDNNYDFNYNSSSLEIQKASQTITFEQDDVLLSDGTVTLSGSSSSGLSLVYELISGPGELNGDMLTLNDLGTIVIVAHQNGSTHRSIVSINEKIM